jgi:hypothetical protein
LRFSRRQLRSRRRQRVLRLPKSWKGSFALHQNSPPLPRNRGRISGSNVLIAEKSSQVRRFSFVRHVIAYGRILTRGLDCLLGLLEFLPCTVELCYCEKWHVRQRTRSVFHGIDHNWASASCRLLVVE